MNRFYLLLSFFGLAFPTIGQSYDLLTPRTKEGHQILKHSIQASEVSISKSLHRAPEQAASVVDSVQYTAFGQSFYDGSAFSFDGGKFSKYKTTLVWYEDGSVRIDNLFNLRTHNNCQDQELSLWGTYDAAEGLISIATPLDEMTPVALIYGELDGFLMAGEVKEDYNFYPSDALELRVSDDRHSIETLQNALILEEYDGTLSTHTCYKYVKLFTACEGQKLATFSNESINFGTPLYPGTSLSKSIYIANVGTDALDYVLDVESADEASPFSVKPTSGTLRSMIMKEVKVTYSPQQVGSHSAQLCITSEGGDSQLPIFGTCVDYPDYASLVEEGEISFSTSVDYPFELGWEGLDLVAYSTIGYNAGDSWLDAIVEVPEGKIGTLRWAGHSYSDYNWGSRGSVMADDEKLLFKSYMGDEDFSGHCMFSSGQHKVRFNFNVSHPEFVTDDDGMTLYSLGFTLMDLVDDAAILPEGDCLKFGNFIENQPDATLRAKLLNTGKNDLKCLSADDAPYFHVVVNDEAASTLDTLHVSVIYDVTDPGTYAGDIVLHTTAGDYKFACSAMVRATPDYTPLIAADSDPTVEVHWDYSTTDPFLMDMETVEAVNSNAREIDSIASVSWMQASFVIPEGKVGVVSWDASLDIEDVQPDGSYHDLGMVFISHPCRQYGIFQVGKGDLSSYGCYNCWDMEDATAEYYTSGENSIRWSVSHYGDSYYEGTDEFRVSNLRIQLEDFPEYAYSTSVEEIDFGQLLLGKTNSVTVKLTNLGGQVLTIDKIECDEPAFISAVPTYGAAFKVSFDLNFQFEGLWPGENEGAITIYTNAGEVVLLYHAFVIDPEGYLLAEDFEDEMRWFRSDADGDGKGWNSLYNIYSTMSMGHCHSGEDGLGSSGYYYYLGDIDPDDWCYSPMVQIPAEGEYELSWWMGVDDTDTETYAHNYSVYVGEVMDRQILTHMYSEQIESTGWQQRAISLKDWAGKEVCVSFRHHNSYGMGIMKLDDVYIRPVTESGISQIGNDASNIRIYNLQGQRQQHLGKGINIICNPGEGNKIIQH